jgi:hypothetical protein
MGNESSKGYECRFCKAKLSTKTELYEHIDKLHKAEYDSYMQSKDNKNTGRNKPETIGNNLTKSYCSKCGMLLINTKEIEHRAIDFCN